MKCECGQKIPANLSKCPNCGKINEKANFRMICKDCGDELFDSNIKRCPKCGGKIKRVYNKKQLILSTIWVIIFYAILSFLG